MIAKRQIGRVSNPAFNHQGFSFSSIVFSPLLPFCYVVVFPNSTNWTDAFESAEASNFKYPQQSPVALHQSTEDFLLQEFK